MNTPFLSIVLCLFTTVFVFADENTNKLIGHWRYSDANAEVDLNFHKDGGFDGTVSQAGKVVWEYGGKWSTSGGVIYYEYTKSSVERIPVGTRDEDKIAELTAEYYTIVARDGSQRTYKRVKAQPQIIRADILQE